MLNLINLKLILKSLIVSLILTFGTPIFTYADDSQFNLINITDKESLLKNYTVEGVSNSINPYEAKNNLYQQIVDEMNSEYQHIGEREAARVLKNNNLEVFGGLNSIGFNYRRPFVDFSISVDRNLAPDLFDDKRWIVTDTFNIFIDASKVLSNLKSKNLIDISEKNLGAFAGIVFKRTFTWVHFANTYQEGLTTHFEKLFMPFTALQFQSIAQMGKNEMIFKEDSMSLVAGGLVTAPIYSGISGAAGVLAKFSKMSRVEIVDAKNEKTNIDEILLTYEKSKLVTAGASLSVSLDFLKLLKMTLLSYDFSYELESSYKIYLNLKKNDLGEMNTANPVAMEIQQILKNREGDLDVLAPYLISEEKKISKQINHKYNFLLFGGQKSSRTQQIEVAKDGRVKTFFRHYYEKIKYTEDLLSRIFASIIYALANTESSAAKVASDSKKVTLEYDSDRNLVDTRSDLNVSSVNGEQKLSLTFSSNFETKKSVGNSGSKYKERASFMLERFSGIDPIVLSFLKTDHIQAPLNLTGNYQVNIEGIRYFNSLSINQVFDSVDSLCNEQPKNKFFNFRSLFNNCKMNLENDYIDYFKDLSHEKVTAKTIEKCEANSAEFDGQPSKERNYIRSCIGKLTLKGSQDWVNIPLWKLKNVTTGIVNNCNSKVHYYNLFGASNVFFFGSLNAKTSDGRDFNTSFHEGAFKGLGVVDHFMRVENLRSPSSIVVDQ